MNYNMREYTDHAHLVQNMKFIIFMNNLLEIVHKNFQKNVKVSEFSFPATGAKYFIIEPLLILMMYLIIFRDISTVNWT